MENKYKDKKLFSFLDYKVQPFIYSNPKSTISLDYSRHNESYEVIKNEVTYMEQEKSFKDFIHDNLNPIIDNNEKSIYGEAPTLEPLTTRINKAKSRLEEANNKKQDLERQIRDLESQTLEQETEQKGEPKND